MGRSGGAASGASFAELYAELCVIGRGSFGEVLKVRRRSDSRTLVCKVLSYGQMSEKEKQLVVSEVNILRELKHRHVVQYFDRVLDKRAAKIYIIMEYCENGDMGRQIKRMRRDRSHFEETRVWKFLAQLLLAFEACHNRKDIILHRDIKPCNIFLDRDMNIKVGDFGLAKELGAESQFAYTNVGTPYYMSPELINEKRYNEKSDIWALGCLIYEMCALRPPFEAANVVSLGKRISAGRFSRIPMRYSDELQAVVQSMLTLSPTRRPSVSQLMSLPRVGSYVVRARESITRSMARASESTEGSTSATSSAASSKAEAALAARAKEIRNREHALRVKEKQLVEREDEVRRREQAVREQEDALVHREEALAARESRTADLEAEFAARQRKSAVTAATTPTSASETLSTLSHGSLADHRGFRLTVDACASDDDDDDGNHAQGVRNHKDRENHDTADSIRSRDPAEEQETLITPRLSTRPQRQRPATGSDRRRGVISRGSPPATTGFADGAAPSQVRCKK
ncbi:Serine/threonine-protein kinase Nek2 [Hondaea fermentalgiana]|uniref:non-specific serine/threonine protein kinase n=1 Tax=Hondaea fermentalgiana TaxID=2315210 RepID=A0A2R5GDW5_9STRA|nr:Serine/threonine-protein kinase Nek2 [Hondaea fermentalgiana]|eukprot:GBG29127.1 Serine/threonine-protein kinase Nek2 [Hondaea fermentalgiana]